MYLLFSSCLKNPQFSKKTQKSMKNHIEQAMTENELFGFKPVSVKTTPVYKSFWSWLTGKPHHYTIEASFETVKSDPLEQLEAQIQKDSDYAWSVYCKLAMSMFDRMSEAKECELKAAKIMTRMFNVDITTHPKYPMDKPEPTKAVKLDTMAGSILSPVKQTVELIDHGKTGLLFREFRRRMGVHLEDFSDPCLNSEQPFKSSYNHSIVAKLESGDARWTDEFFQELIDLTTTIAKLKSTTAY